MNSLTAATAGALCGVSVVAFFLGLLLHKGALVTVSVGGFLGGLALYALADGTN